MPAPNHNIPPWRSVLERILIRSREYRHLRAWAGARIAGGIILVICGVLTLSVGSYGWAALFLGLAALAFAFGYGRSRSPAPHLPEPEPARLALVWRVLDGRQKVPR